MTPLIAKATKTRPLVKRLTKCAVYLPVRAFKKSMKACTITPTEACHISAMVGSSVSQDDRRGFDAKLKDRSFNFVGSGVHRRVYTFKNDKCVLKVGTNEKWADSTGPEANMIETDAYLEALSDPRFSMIKGHINPIVAHSLDYRWLVVPRARTDENDHLSRDEIRDVQDVLTKKLSKSKVCCPDLHNGNVGKLENKPVIIDSGFKMTCRIPKTDGSCPIITKKIRSTIQL